MTTAAQISIEKNAEAVWAVITDIRRFPQIIEGVEKIDVLEQPATGIIGLRWNETRLYFGKPSTIEKRIVDARDQSFYTTESIMDGFVFSTTLTISAVGNHVVLKSSHETTTIGFIAKLKSIPMIFFKGILKKAIRQELEDFKVAIEHT